MILIDTSLWVEHLRSGKGELAALLERGEACVHRFVLGELMLGGVTGDILTELRALPRASEATTAEVDALIQRGTLTGRGIGYVDAALLASALLDEVQLWTLDKRLSAIAAEHSIGMN